MSRYCSRCGKSQKACICQWIVPLASEVELIILQHTSEEHRPLGTARILNLSLDNCICLIGEDFSCDDALNHLLADESYQHFVLYPSEESRCISEITQASHSVSKKIRLILLDGTW